MGKKKIAILVQLVIVLLMGSGCLVENNAAAGKAKGLAKSEKEDWRAAKRIELGLVAYINRIVSERKATVVIDAGHGGEQPGCVVGKTMEKDVNLSIALALREELESRGIGVILTRSDDRNVQMEDRTDYASLIFADYFISIHCNAYVQDRSVQGFQCFYYQSEEGKTLSDEITDMVEEKGIRIRRAGEVDFRVLRESSIPAVLIEVGYLTNYEERTALISEEYQRDMAITIAEGIGRVLQSGE